MIHLLRIVVFVLLSSQAVFSHADDKGCRRCDQRGVVECPKHDEELLDYEGRVEFCSVAAACEVCAGALLIDCKHCEGGPESAAIGERQKAVAEWMATDAMGDFLKRPVPHVETKRFQLVVDTGPLKLGKKKISGHKIMHMVADDVESVRSQIAEHFAVKDTGYFSKMRMWIWSDPADHSAVMRKFLLATSTGDFKLLGKDPVFSVWTERNFKTVPGVRMLFTHNAAHMLLSNLGKMLWTGDTGGGFFDAGSAHWYEYQIHERSLNYCIEESTVELNYHNGQWRSAIRKRLSKDETRVLPRLLPMNSGAMSLPDQALCWSFYDWLVAVHPDKLRAIHDQLKLKRAGRDVLEEVLGMKVLPIEAQWREWVDQIYPLKGDKPRTPKKPKKKR